MWNFTTCAGWWATALTDTIPDLRRQWIGQRRGMHVDSYRRITRVDGHRVEVLEEPETEARRSGTPQLWFVNLGRL